MIKLLFWKGTFSAIIAGILALVVADWVASLLTQLFAMDRTDSALFKIVFILIFHLANFFWMGMTAAFFWHRIRLQTERLVKLLLILVPYYSFPFIWMAAHRQRVDFLAGVPFVLVATLLSLWLLDASIRFGLKWWPKRRYRHFFGLTNDYESDEETKSP